MRHELDAQNRVVLALFLRVSPGSTRPNSTFPLTEGKLMQYPLHQSTGHAEPEAEKFEYVEVWRKPKAMRVVAAGGRRHTRVCRN